MLILVLQVLLAKRVFATVCQSTCMTCDNSTECTSCMPYMKFNTTTKLCDFCSDGQFYAQSINLCIDCGSSCTAYCAYKSTCYDCPSGQFYDIDSMSCVQTCNSISQIPINSTQTGNKAYCRSFNYYVNPLSTEVVEFGSKMFPFKSLSLPFIEILNYHSNSNRTINIYVMENSTNYLLLSNNYIINMNSINIYTYSSTNSTAKASTIILRESDVDILNQQTKFNVLQSSVLNTTIVSNVDPSYLLDKSKSITLYKTSFSISNFNVFSEYADVNSAYSMIKAYMLGSKQVSIKNMYFQITGGIFRTSDPLVMNAQNILFDMYKAQFAIVIYAVCNYPEAVLDGGLYIDNFTVYDSQTRIVSLTEYIVQYSGPGNMIVNKFNCSVYMEFPSNDPIMGILAVNECDPSTTQIQYANITNSYLTMPENPNLIRHAVYLLNAASGVNGRPAITAFKNNYFENIYLSLWPPFWAGSLPTIPTFTENNVYRNCSSQTFVNRIEGITIYMNNDTFDTSYGNTNYIVYIGFPPVASIKGVTFKNINGCTSNSCISYGEQILLDALPSASVTIDGLIVQDSIMGPNSFIKIYSNFTGSFTIKNSVFTNIEVYNGYPLIFTGDISGATFQNITFQNIYSSNDLDSSNRLIKFTSINLGRIANYMFDSIKVYNSTVPF